MKPSKILAIKNMVCARCIRVVKEELQQLGYSIEQIELGKVVLKEELSTDQWSIIQKVMQQNGFEVIESQQAQLVESVKTLIIEHIHHKQEKPSSVNFSEFLAQRTGSNYFNLSKLFSSLEGITIEKYIILQKIERVKELLIYGEKNLSEIAFELDYSSVSHLSGQFKKVTGLSPTAFLKLTGPRRKSLDDIQ